MDSLNFFFLMNFVLLYLSLIQMMVNLYYYYFRCLIVINNKTKLKDKYIKKKNKINLNIIKNINYYYSQRKKIWD